MSHESLTEQRLKMLEMQLEILSRVLGVDSRDEPVHPAVQHSTRLLQAVERLAPLRPLLEAEEVNDILINSDRSVYIERLGRLEKAAIQFENDEEVFKLAEEIAERIGRTINPHRPLVDARLPDGSRVNIIAPPLSVDGTMISIRKFSKNLITIDRMVAQENLSAALGEFLKVVGKCRLNIIVSGGTGSGKTTLLNAISQHIEPAERIVTIEDAAELKLQQPHVVRLESKPVSFGRHREVEVTIRELVKNALRMRPDRIIVGEVRGAEAFDMMQAMNTGHEGSLTSVHANHPRDAIVRVENMMNMANLNLPSAGIRAQIASAIHLVVQTSRMRDGHRRITHVSEVVGMESDIITMQDLFTFQTKGEDSEGKLLGEFRWSGIMPRFLRRVAYYGEADRLAKALNVRLPPL
jgi:pilus assembly protein CpaF